MKIVNSFGFCGNNYYITTNGKEFYVYKQNKNEVSSKCVARGFKNEQEATSYINGLYNQCVPDDEMHLKENRNMKKQTIKLNESQLVSLIKESVKKVLKENNTQSWANTLIDAIANDEETLGYFDDRFLYSKEYSQSEAPIARQWGEMDEYEKAKWILQNSDTRALTRKLRMKGLISKLTESRNLIDFTTSDIWSKYNIPWNEVDDNPEEYQGLWHISFNVFDYTYCMGTIDIDETFSSLEECLTFVQNLTYEEIFDYIEENISSLNDEGDLEYVSERISAVSFNILCKTQNGDYEVANTRPYSPKL